MSVPSRQCLASPHVPVSWGELLDKITILEIKQERIRDTVARANVTRELRELWQIGAEALGHDGIAEPFAALKAVNAELWAIEDAIRQEEARSRFDCEFIHLARAVYQKNDRRAAIKRQINQLLSSELVEEKSYWTAPPLPDLPGTTPASAQEAPAASPALHLS